jgi:dTDP-4-dehydrorhamnose reductase
VTGFSWFVTGAGGMLGREVVTSLSRAGQHVSALSRADLDLTREDSVSAALAGLGPGDVVINCAAWTAVDDAETAEPQAFAVNATGPQLLARHCRRAEARLVQVSTDYVFAGDATVPYPADAPLAPRSAYGRTKAAGEWAVRAELDSAWIVRTAWLYGDGPSFVRTMAHLESTREFVDVVDDQFGQPTWTRDLAERMIEMVESRAPFGTYHGCSSGSTSWHGLARAVFCGVGADPDRVRHTTSAAFARPAPRPAYSVLDLGQWQGAGLKPLRAWDDALADAISSATVTAH